MCFKLPTYLKCQHTLFIVGNLTWVKRKYINKIVINFYLKTEIFEFVSVFAVPVSLKHLGT